MRPVRFGLVVAKPKCLKGIIKLKQTNLNHGRVLNSLLRTHRDHEPSSRRRSRNRSLSYGFDYDDEDEDGPPIHGRSKIALASPRALVGSTCFLKETGPQPEKLETNAKHFA